MASPFRPALQLLGQYAEFHRDRRNIATHFVGVPMIMFGSLVLLSRPAFELAGLALSPAWLVLALVIAWTLSRGALALGVATSVLWLVLAALAHAVPGGAWWAWGLGAFVLGWIIQFVGHYYEGRKPAFADDLVGLLVGPMFVTLEALAMAGLFKRQIAAIEAHAGPTLIRNLAHPA
jgi:uncharacterized membrane protein YGL010W